ncbi:hypothetical protein Y032_0007g3434 [Ancylostoma ceylanicum]|uniref:F-box domain-containing protein n=1 Tax=Ancylostoma ceylanicum TaxID=53326 RepID=A0A016VP20_9BILA|nr:hypothetical protein Y032_0007g3434 [Ancylostoma ceylanicum]
MDNGEDFLLLFRPEAFESEFSCWSELPIQMKITILEYLPYPTLRNFMFLSRECLALASKLKTEACSLMLQKSCFQGIALVEQYTKIAIHVYSANVSASSYPPG